jgi:predicted RNase H-like HicB family nuclease
VRRELTVGDTFATAHPTDLPGVLSYGATRQDAIERVRVLSLRVIADRLDHGEAVHQMSGVFAVTS